MPFHHRLTLRTVIIGRNILHILALFLNTFQKSFDKMMCSLESSHPQPWVNNGGIWCQRQCAPLTTESMMRLGDGGRLGGVAGTYIEKTVQVEGEYPNTVNNLDSAKRRVMTSSSLAVSFFCLLALSSACYIQNCPIGGKRSVLDLMDVRKVRQVFAKPFKYFWNLVVNIFGGWFTKGKIECSLCKGICTSPGIPVVLEPSGSGDIALKWFYIPVDLFGFL